MSDNPTNCLYISLSLSPIAERVLRYCESPSVGTCCTYNMETRMAGQSRQQLEWHTKEQITKMSGLLGGKAAKFNGKLNPKNNPSTAT